VAALALLVLFIIGSFGGPSTPKWDAAREQQVQREIRLEIQMKHLRENEERAKERERLENWERKKREREERIRETMKRRAGRPSELYREPVIDRNGPGIDDP
jgi:hypothetical protein